MKTETTLSALSIEALTLLATKLFVPFSENEREGFYVSDAALKFEEPDTNENGEETYEGNLWIFDPTPLDGGGPRLERFNLSAEGEFFFVIESVYASAEETPADKFESPAARAVAAAENDEPEPGDEEEGGFFNPPAEAFTRPSFATNEPNEANGYTRNVSEDGEETLSAFDAFGLIVAGDVETLTISEEEKTGAVYVRDGEDGPLYSFGELSPDFEKGEASTLEIFSRLSSGSLKFGSVIGTDFETFEPSDAFARIAYGRGFTYVYYVSEGKETEDGAEPGNVVLDVLDQRGTRERSRRFVFAEEN